MLIILRYLILIYDPEWRKRKYITKSLGQKEYMTVVKLRKKFKYFLFHNFVYQIVAPYEFDDILHSLEYPKCKFKRNFYTVYIDLINQTRVFYLSLPQT